MSDGRDRARPADGDPPGRPDHGAMRRGGRRLSGARVAGLVGAMVVVGGVAGGLALWLTADEPSPPVIDEPRPERTSPTPAQEEDEGEDADGDGDEGSDEGAASGWVPPTAVEDGQRVLTLRFPGGVTAVIAYPAEVELHELGATPGAELSIAVEDGAEDLAAVARSYGRPRVSVPMQFHRGTRDDVLRGLNDGQPPELLGEYPGSDEDPVPLYETSAWKYLAWQAGGWTLLLPDAWATPYGAEPRDPEENRATYAANLHVSVDPEGWPTVTADPPVRVDAPYVAFGGGPDPARPTLGPAGQALVVVRASACALYPYDPDADRATSRRQAPRRAWSCDPGTQLELEVTGSEEFVASLAHDLEARASDYPPSIIDPGWVTEDAKEAWQADHGDGTWVVGYFYPPDIWDHDFEDWPEVFVPRWKRISDDDLGLDREAELREALTALTGPPPPRLGNLWQRRVLGLTSAELDGSELVLDFAAVFASGEGSSGGAIMGTQFYAVALHYYPEADSICVLADEMYGWLHEAEPCPSRDSAD